MMIGTMILRHPFTLSFETALVNATSVSMANLGSLSWDEYSSSTSFGIKFSNNRPWTSLCLISDLMVCVEIAFRLGSSETSPWTMNSDTHLASSVVRGSSLIVVMRMETVRMEFFCETSSLFLMEWKNCDKLAF
ncbi:hypothetical protein OGAPHI_006894 [Ogataea philodendri]|uniref:Uncharacterized protein n=1 Tax=Ogataea philodendri TaxID=1378263 RepID=A0A9P8NTY7_9ASCO|nr:uncharacterized protein OGAPHI_006894 [Ogataea philodendri]KAH3660308.1 hypothetical protein OGAPHI_006894 [Ogataea philodendri]